MAADISVPEPGYDWSGFYGGAFGSYAFGTAKGSVVTKCGPCSDSFDIDGTGFHGTIGVFDIGPLAHVRARVGFAVDRVLPFVAGGLTVGDGDTHCGWRPSRPKSRYLHLA